MAIPIIAIFFFNLLRGNLIHTVLGWCFHLIDFL